MSRDSEGQRYSEGISTDWQALCIVRARARAWLRILDLPDNVARQLAVAGYSVLPLPAAGYRLRQVAIAGYVVLASCVAGDVALALQIAG